MQQVKYEELSNENLIESFTELIMRFAMTNHNSEEETKMLGEVGFVKRLISERMGD